MATTRYEITALCAQIRRIESIPTSNNTFTDTDLAELLNIEFQSAIVPLIQSTREEFFVTSRDFTVTLALPTITIPSDAIGMRLRDVAIVDTATNQLTYLPRISPEELTYGTSLYGYTIIGNSLVTHITNPSATIRVSYFKRPGDLSTAYGVILSKGTSNTLVMNALPTGWTTSTVVDIISGNSPFAIVNSLTAITTIAGATITVSAGAYALASVGDYVAVTTTSPVPQYIPIEAHYLLIQGAAVRCLEALGDREGWKVAANKYTVMSHDLLNLINPRVESQSKKIIPRNNIARAIRRG